MKNIWKIVICIIILTIILCVIYITVNASRTEETNQRKIWVGTFQLAWNELIKQIGSSVELEGERLILVDNLNKQSFTKEMLNENSYYIKTGIIRTELKNEIETNLMNKFNFESNVLDRINWNDKENKYLIYSMINKKFTFVNPFEKFTEPFRNSKEQLKYFGLDAQTNTKSFEQTTALFYNSKNDFAIKISTKEGEEVILYRTASQKDFETSYNELVEKTNSYKGNKKLTNGNDELKVPYIKINKDISYDELCNKIIKGTGGALIEQAIQTIDFSMDNYGGNIKSEAAIYGVASISEEEPRYFNFNDTFLLYLKEKDKENPYFALKIDNTDFLVKDI